MTPSLHHNSRPSPSIFPVDGSWLDQVDKSLTGQLASAELGAWELPFSFFGCIFGSPLSLLVGPLLISVSHDRHGANPLAAPVLAILSAAVVLGWAEFVHTANQQFVRDWYYSSAAFLVAPPLGALAAYLLSSPAGFNHGSFHTTLWMLCIVPIALGKRLANRRRPVVCAECFAVWTPRRVSVICDLLKTDANAAFPSGDVAGAAAFAVPLWTATRSLPLPVLCVALAAYGRIYWRAHHLLDVVVGAVNTLLVARGLRILGLGGPAVHWAEPHASAMVSIACLAALREYQNHQRRMGKPQESQGSTQTSHAMRR